MCLALPGEIVEFASENEAKVRFGESEIMINLSFIDNPKIGDYVIAHSGFALSLLDTDEAEKDLEVWREFEASRNES